MFIMSARLSWRLLWFLITYLPWRHPMGESTNVCATLRFDRRIRIDRRLPGLAGPDYDAPISFGLPFEPEDSQYGKS